MKPNDQKAQDPAPSVGTAKPLFLTRAQHDALLRADQPLLQSAFNESKKGRAYGAAAHCWTLEGVTFHAISLETAEKIGATLAKVGPDALRMTHTFNGAKLDGTREFSVCDCGPGTSLPHHHGPRCIVESVRQPDRSFKPLVHREGISGSLNNAKRVLIRYVESLTKGVSK